MRKRIRLNITVASFNYLGIIPITQPCAHVPNFPLALSWHLVVFFLYAVSDISVRVALGVPVTAPNNGSVLQVYT
jgi:hypothetical protein